MHSKAHAKCFETNSKRVNNSVTNNQKFSNLFLKDENSILRNKNEIIKCCQKHDMINTCQIQHFKAFCLYFTYFWDFLGLK